MLDDIFVFDNVVHVYDLSEDNVSDAERGAELGRRSILGLGEVWRSPSNREKYGNDYGRRFSAEEVGRFVFEESTEDMAMAQAVPIFDWFTDGFAPIHAQYEFAQAYPERGLFCGGVDPVYHGVERAREEIVRQVEEMGARSFKFYNAHPNGRSWRCDDRELAYPLYQRIMEMGIDVVQFHKGVPFGPIYMEDFRPNDIQGAAYDFPDLNFVIHHLAEPYEQEAISICARYPNVYLALSGPASNYLLAPRKFQKQLGQMLQECGSEKLLWGSEAALYGSPQPYLEAFLEMEIPEDLQEGYGYPQVTREDKRRILGENFARLMKVDVEEKRRELAEAGPA
jgi:predicted TIM-barrel fold metal-dependent hydrolase